MGDAATTALPKMVGHRVLIFLVDGRVMAAVLDDHDKFSNLILTNITEFVLPECEIEETGEALEEPIDYPPAEGEELPPSLLRSMGPLFQDELLLPLPGNMMLRRDAFGLITLLEEEGAGEAGEEEGWMRDPFLRVWSVACARKRKRERELRRARTTPG